MQSHHTSTRSNPLSIHALLRKSAALLSAVALSGLCLFAAPSIQAQSAPNSITSPSQGGYTEGHVYLYTPDGASDVTNNIFTMYGCTFVQHNNTVQQVIMGYTEGHVYNTKGQVIGFIYRTAS
jgi:hypothetical protein